MSEALRPLIKGDRRTFEFLAKPICVLAITSRCQQRCTFCVEGRFKCEREAARDLPFSTVARLLDESRKVSAGVVFMGGETALHPDFIAIIERSARLGLTTMVTTNLQRFADADFLKRCVDAGLHSVECSFHHPDAESFSRETQTSARSFDRIIGALENIKALHGRPGASWFGAVVNIVVQRHNVERLDEVLSHLRRHLGSAARLIHFKGLQTVTRDAQPVRIDSSLVPEPEKVRTSLLRMLDGWDRLGTLPVLRDFPLCIAPGYAHLNAELVDHCRQLPLISNRGHWEHLRREMLDPFRFDLRPEGATMPPECDGCSLNALCLAVTKGNMISQYGLTPKPSAQSPEDVLRNIGLEPAESTAFVNRCTSMLEATRQLLTAASGAPAAAPVEPVSPPASEPAAPMILPPAFTPEALALQRRLSRCLLTRSSPKDFAGFRVSFVAMPAGEQGVVVSLFRRESGAARLDRLLVEVAPVRGGGASCFRRIGDYAVSYRASTPLDSEPRRLALEAILGYLKRRLSAG